MLSKLMGIMIEEYGQRRLAEHAIKVYAYCAGIGGEEGLCGEEYEVLCAAAILHDIGIPRAIELHGSAAGPYQEKEGMLTAPGLMEKAGFGAEAAQKVAWLVGHHHTHELAKGNRLLQILMEADYLVNLSEGSASLEDAREKALGVRDNFFVTSAGKRYINALFGL